MKYLALLIFLSIAIGCVHPAPVMPPGQTFFVFQDRSLLREYLDDKMYAVKSDTVTKNPIDTVHFTSLTGGLAFFKDTLQAFQLYSGIMFSEEHLFNGRNVFQLYTSSGKKAQLEFTLAINHLTSTLRYSNVVFDGKSAVSVKSDDPNQDSTVWILK